jgi:5-methyltetrahydropteroyltriglutamate--homocysteine methyltransferase
MKLLPAQLTGIFARSKELIRATRDFDRRRTTFEELEKIRRADVKKIISLQKDFEFLVDGNLHWQDLFRPFTKAAGIELGPLTRFFETNTFYRRPVIKGKIKFEPKEIERYIYLDLLPANKKVILPGPVTFYGLSENSYYKKDFMIVVAKLISKVIKYLVQKGVKSVQLSEPFLAYHGKQLTSKDFAMAKDAYQIIVDAKNNAEISLHTYFGDFTAIAKVLKLPVDSITIDLISTDLKKLKFETDKKIGLGCIDAANSLLENPEETMKFTSTLIKKLKLNKFFVCPNCDLDFLPQPVAVKKVAILRKVASEFRN